MPHKLESKYQVKHWVLQNFVEVGKVCGSGKGGKLKTDSCSKVFPKVVQNSVTAFLFEAMSLKRAYSLWNAILLIQNAIWSTRARSGNQCEKVGAACLISISVKLSCCLWHLLAFFCVFSLEELPCVWHVLPTVVQAQRHSKGMHRHPTSSTRVNVHL